jgi:hypothetical protein
MLCCFNSKFIVFLAIHICTAHRSWPVEYPGSRYHIEKDGWSGKMLAPFMTLRGGNPNQNAKETGGLAGMNTSNSRLKLDSLDRLKNLSTPSSGTQRGLNIHMHAIIQCTKAGETVRFEAGEYNFDELVEIDRCLHLAHAKPTKIEDIEAVEKAISSATTNINASAQAATTVVRIWGHWSFLNGTEGSVRNLTTVAASRAANYPTLDLLGGPWAFEFCGLRSVGGTAALIYGNGNISMTNCAVGGLPGAVKAGYGLTVTDDGVAVARLCVFERCRHAGARFVRRARGELVDCVFDRCIMQGAKNAVRGRNGGSRPELGV